MIWNTKQTKHTEEVSTGVDGRATGTGRGSLAKVKKKKVGKG